MSPSHHILMISKGSELFKGLAADTVQRHEDYARSIDAHIWMIVLTENQNYQALNHKRFCVLPSNSDSPVRYFSDAKELADEIAYKNKIDLIVAQDPFFCGAISTFLKKKYQVKLQIQDHSCFFSSKEFQKEKWFRPAYTVWGRWNLRKADSIRTVNQTEAQTIKSFGIPADKIVVQPVPIQLESFQKKLAQVTLDSCKRELGLDLEKKTLLWIGRPSSEKNFSLFKQGFQILRSQNPQYQAIVIGFADKNEEGLFYLDKRDYQELPKFYQLSDVLISTSKYEGYGRVYVEALYSGIPVIATKTADYQEVVPEALQACFDSSPKQMAAAIESFFKGYNPTLFSKELQSFRNNFPTYEQSLQAITEEWQRLMTK